MMETMKLLKGQLSKMETDEPQPAVWVQHNIVREAIRATWTIDKVCGILAELLSLKPQKITFLKEPLNKAQEARGDYAL